MTGLLENPGVGHNQPSTEGDEEENQHWERWAKKRTFVRALEGTYSHLYKQLVEPPRVYFVAGRAVEGRARPLRQARHQAAARQRHPVDRDRISRPTRRAPTGQKHGHLNSAVLLRAQGPRPRHPRRPPHRLEGRRRHVRRERLRASALQRRSDEEAILLVFKAKPLFLFMHLLFQKIVEWPPEEAAEGSRGLQAADGHLSTSWQDAGPRFDGRRMLDADERGTCRHRSREGAVRQQTCSFRADDVAASQEFREAYESTRERRAAPRTCRSSIPPTG